MFLTLFQHVGKALSGNMGILYPRFLSRNTTSRALSRVPCLTGKCKRPHSRMMSEDYSVHPVLWLLPVTLDSSRTPGDSVLGTQGLGPSANWTVLLVDFLCHLWYFRSFTKDLHAACCCVYRGLCWDVVCCRNGFHLGAASRQCAVGV